MIHVDTQHLAEQRVEVLAVFVRVVGQAAVAMRERVGQHFTAVVTGVTPKGTFVRVLNPPVEGILCRGQEGADVGDKLQVTLLSTDPERGYLDFGR